MATILECSELTKKYGSHRAVDNLNLQINVVVSMRCLVQMEAERVR